MKNKYDKKHLPFGNAFAIADPLVTQFLSNLDIDVTKVTQDHERGHDGCQLNQCPGSPTVVAVQVHRAEHE